MGIEEFLAEWRNDSATVLVHTSGSTGEPKPMWVEKRRMEASARLTCDVLGLHEGDTALLCMSLDFIAGKMMVVRSLVRGLRLLAVPPGGHPLAEVADRVDFAAMIPLQVYNSLQVPEERERLRQIRHLIIGGGAIDDGVAAKLSTFPNHVWSTYGMTETLSHIALRRLSGPQVSDWYEPFPGVTLSIAPESTAAPMAASRQAPGTNQKLQTSDFKLQCAEAAGCLVIDAPAVHDGPLVTNDIAMIAPDGRFKILGRKDNVICSGGLKIQAEEVERLLAPHLREPFIITKRRDPKFGEAVVLLSEGDTTLAEQICRRVLPRYWQPRTYMHMDHIPRTATGKPIRRAV